MRTLQSIIEETDALVPNPFDNTKKVMWINSINKEFFEVVKIPVIHTIFSESGESTYNVPIDIRARNVDQVKVGGSFYRSSQYEDVNPGHNQWLLDEESNQFTFVPRPRVDGLAITVRYGKMWSTTYLTTNMSATMDAPSEYQDIYVYGLCERVAKAMNDVTLANNYGVDYRERLASAQQTYGLPPTAGGAKE